MIKSILVTAPTVWVITLKQALTHCHANEGDEDDNIVSYIKSAQSRLENIWGRALTPQTRRLPLEVFPSSSAAIKLPFSPLIAVTHLKYYDTNNVQQTLTGYVTDSESVPALIYPPETGWPATYDRAHPAVSVVYTCGHDDDKPLDEDVRNFIRLWVGLSYQSREPVEVGMMIQEYPRVWEAIIGHPYLDVADYSE